MSRFECKIIKHKSVTQKCTHTKYHVYNAKMCKILKHKYVTQNRAHNKILRLEVNYRTYKYKQQVYT